MKDTLHQKFNFATTLSLVVGVVVGIGIFFKTTPVLEKSGMNPNIAIAAWILGGVVSIIAGLTAAELGARFTKTGGIVAYGEHIYGRKVGFIFGFVQSILYGPAINAALAFYFALFTCQFLNITPTLLPLLIISVVSICFTAAINIFSAKLGGWIQQGATYIKLIPLIVIIIASFLYQPESSVVIDNTPIVVNNSPWFLTIGAALLPVLFTFDGWLFVGTITKEIKNASKVLPLAIVGGLGIISLIYALINIGLLNAFSPLQIVNTGIFGLSEILFGKMGSKFVTLAIVISAYGGLNGYTIYSQRMLYSLAINDLFIGNKFLGKVNKKLNSPVNSALTMLGIILIYLSLIFLLPNNGDFSVNADLFTDIPVATIWILYTLIFTGVIILRHREPDAQLTYRVPLYPLLPIIAILTGVFVVINAIISNIPYFILTMFLTIICFIIFLILDHQKTKKTI